MTESKSNRLGIFIILFNCKQDVKTYEEIAQLKLEPINNFVDIIEKRFEKFFDKNGRHLNILTPNFRIYCSTEALLTNGREIDIYGEDGLHEFIALAKKHNWKIYDKDLNCFIDLDLAKNFSYSDYKKLKKN